MASIVRAARVSRGIHSISAFNGQCRAYSIRPKKSLIKPSLSLGSKLAPKAATSSVLGNAAKTASVKGKNVKAQKHNVQPSFPARTRFAPSPTGYLHMGSLRTALYNYLLARLTNGQFLLRVEDTDQTRLVPDAEQNIYETLRWCGITIDEGPAGINGADSGAGGEVGPYGPYRQSDRFGIYKEYAQELLDKGLAYRCFCSKDRLNKLTESAKQLKPPTTVSYDRHCTHISPEESEVKANELQQQFTIRFKSPKMYSPFTDLLHGTVNLQPQINVNDVRYEDPILIKSDGLPTYHFANVVDDHLMKITHVIRGEEWLASTPKHIALYEAFGWSIPQFVHIPLLTSTSEKKLSKRSGDSNVLSLRQKGILPEALVNFCVLFGWAPIRENPGEKSTEIYELDKLEKLFSLNELTKGNAKVDMTKLYYFNKVYLHKRLQDPKQFKEILDEVYQNLVATHGFKELTKDKLELILRTIGPNLSTINELHEQHWYLMKRPAVRDSESELEPSASANFVNEYVKTEAGKAKIVSLLQACLGRRDMLTRDNVSELISAVFNEAKERSSSSSVSEQQLTKKDIFQTLRFALSGGVPGVKINLLVEMLGQDETVARLQQAVEYLESLKLK